LRLWRSEGMNVRLKLWQVIWKAVKRNWRDGIVRINWTPIVVGFLLGLVFSFYLVWLNGRIIPGVWVAGESIGGLKLEEAQALLHSRFLAGQQKKVTLNYQKRMFDVVLGTIGIQADSFKTAQRAYALGRTGSLWQRLITIIQACRKGIIVPVQYFHNQMILNAFYRLMDASIGREPVRAVVKVRADGRVAYNPSIEGRLINRNRLTQLFEAAITKSELINIDIPVDHISPTLTSADIKRWSLNRVLGIYLTPFNPGAFERVHNLKTAAEALNNVIIYPGQNFSFNTWVGPRMANTGYKEAPVVIRGKLVPGIGGGVCQVSSTLYNAVLLANLEIVKRYNHSLASGYVPLGRDATVVNGSVDLIFKNNLAAPILLTAEVDPPYVRVAVLGEKKGWERIDLETEIVAKYPFAKLKIEDPQLPWGKVITQPGKPGYKVNLWRVAHYQDGTMRKQRVNTSIYPSQPEESRYGIKIVATSPSP
jgi:vancomycin resistance protein YoaR